MSYSVEFTEQAKADLSELFEYIAYELHSLDYAIGQLDRLEAAVDSLAEYPKRHALYDVEPWRDRGLRMMPVDNYCVFYLPDDGERRVTVLRVLYGGRNIERILRYETK